MPINQKPWRFVFTVIGEIKHTNNGLLRGQNVTPEWKKKKAH